MIPSWSDPCRPQHHPSAGGSPGSQHYSYVGLLSAAGINHINFTTALSALAPDISYFFSVNSCASLKLQLNDHTLRRVFADLKTGLAPPRIPLLIASTAGVILRICIVGFMSVCSGSLWAYWGKEPCLLSLLSDWNSLAPHIFHWVHTQMTE